MLAVTTAETLTLVDTAILKRAPSSISACLDLLDTPTSSSWAPDSSCLYIASGKTLQKYDPISNVLRDIYTHETQIGYMVARSATCIVLSSGSEIYVLEGSQIIQTLNAHKNAISSLSLSNDYSLLASTSSGAVHVHSLSSGSHTAMRGLSNMETNSSTFDFHLRTRLLVASGKQLIIFDTTRPSGPIKTVQLNESATGEVIPAACSPFSKTLVAVATTGGFLGLVDLEKEKALIRTLNVKVRLSTIAFSPEGTAIYLGTETGKILVVDLRALDKPPKVVILSQTGSPVRTINIQKKTRGTTTKTPVPAKKPVHEAVSSRRTASVKSPVRKATVPPSPINRRVVSSASPAKRSMDPKKVLSPLRDPYGNAKMSPMKISPSLKKVSSDHSRRARTLPSTTAPIGANGKDSVSSANAVRTTPQRRPRTLSSVSRVSSKEPLSSVSARPSSSASRALDKEPLSTASTQPSSSSRASPWVTERNVTPSPDIPDIHGGPVTPIPAHKQRKDAMNVLGLGTPDVDQWIRAGSNDMREKGKGKAVGFQDDEEPKEDALGEERERVLSMQISPCRPAASTSTQMFPMPDGPLGSSTGASGSPAGGGPAHELLRTIVQDVMYDFQRESKADMTGLHLDLLRMGRGWKTELRTLMDEYVGDLRDLREENQRLRLENERLRRGAY